MPMRLLNLCLLLFCAAFAVSCVSPYKGASQQGEIPEGYVRYVCQPNGWGPTPEAAIKDLRERLFPWYERNYGDRPGFTIDRDWYALVEVTPGRMWQADGRLWWYVEPAKRPQQRPSVGPDRGIR